MHVNAFFEVACNSNETMLIAYCRWRSIVTPACHTTSAQPSNEASEYFMFFIRQLTPFPLQIGPQFNLSPWVQ